MTSDFRAPSGSDKRLGVRQGGTGRGAKARKHGASDSGRRALTQRATSKRSSAARLRAPIHGLTPSRAEVVRAILDGSAQLGFPPSVREIADRIGASSTNTVQDLIACLRRDGFVVRPAQTIRSIRVTPEGVEALRKWDALRALEATL